VKLHLSDQQRNFALHRIMFDDLLSHEVAECLRRASLAWYWIFSARCTSKTRRNLANTSGETSRPWLRKISRSIVTVVRAYFPQSMLEAAASDNDESGGGYGYLIRCTDEFVRLIWLATRLSNAVGKKTSVKDMVAAFTSERGSLRELARKG
jgi:hypothetical protein